MKILVCKIFTFEAAHYLPNYEGKCKNLHGHTWKVEVEVSGPVFEEGSSKGMVIDFSRLEAEVNKYVSKLDHTLVNNRVKNPTAENIGLWLWRNIKADLCDIDSPIKLEGIKVWETPDSYAEVKIE